MSETVHYRGTMRAVEKLDNESIESQCKRILNNNKLPVYCDSYQEMLLDELYEKFIIYNDVLYSVLKTEIDPEEYMSIASVNENGDINFEVKYYNGGCGFNEAIEEALEKVLKAKEE